MDRSQRQMKALTQSGNHYEISLKSAPNIFKATTRPNIRIRWGPWCSVFWTWMPPPYLERGRTLLKRYRGVNFPKDQTMQQSLASPDTCVYYQVASFYHDFAAAVRQVSPALFDLLESYTLAIFRRNERELKKTKHSLYLIMYEHKNDSSYTFDELRTRMSHFGELAMTSDIMEGFCRNFPEYTDQMKVFIQRDTGDASLCRTALSVLESFVTLLQQLVDGKTDLRQLIEATLVDEDGRPRTEHGQRPSELLVELAEKGDSTYQKYHKLEDDIHIQTRYKRPTDNKKAAFLPPRSTRAIRCPRYSFWNLYRCAPRTCRLPSVKAATGCLFPSPAVPSIVSGYWTRKPAPPARILPPSWPMPRS